ncbi:helix-turn-helix domain-containing protein [Caulobacter segnis]
MKAKASRTSAPDFGASWRAPISWPATRPVTAIGFALGFSEPGSFSRHFFAWAGMAPSAYRATHSGDAAMIAAATALLKRTAHFLGLHSKAEGL